MQQVAEPCKEPCLQLMTFMLCVSQVSILSGPSFRKVTQISTARYVEMFQVFGFNLIQNQ